MKNKLINLVVLFITMSVLTASREDAGVSKAIHPVCSEAVCPNAVNDYAVNIPCKQAPAIAEKNTKTGLVPVDDNELSLSPISRFILLQ